ncbi:putative chitin deacetylase [Serendipita vermifera]|nr:putative chitin deacetylase [Serendipita vermifera]
MLLRALLTATPLPLVALGSLVARQDTVSASTPAVSGSATSTSTSLSPPPEVPFTLVSSNPTAYPLSEIVATPATHTTIALPWTYTGGQEPTVVDSDAPPLPTVSTISITSYPALDQTPPTNSPEVQQWLQEVANSGIPIPNIPPTVAGGCPTNQDRVGNSTICWWTCGQCTRPSDITTCPDKNTWGLSYDDGPSPDTPRLLDYLASQNLHSTFFVVGSRALSRQDILQAEYMQGHQLSVHTWSHPALTTLTNEQIVAELGWTAKIIKDVTGVTPNTFRPPYGDIDDRVRAIGQAMGFTAVIWTGYNNDNFDTNDWHIGAGTVSASGVIAAFENILNQATQLDTGFIVLAHDLYQQSVDLAIGYILPDAIARQNPSFKLMSIIECQHQPLANAYKETNNNSTNPPPNGISQSHSVGTFTASGSSPTGSSGDATMTFSAASWALGLWLVPLIAPLLML